MICHENPISKTIILEFIALRVLDNSDGQDAMKNKLLRYLQDVFYKGT